MKRTSYQSGLTTVVHVTADPGSATGPLEITGTGIARCRPEDLFVPATGLLIATGRAIRDFGRQAEEVGLEESVSQADVARVVQALFLGSDGADITVEVTG